MRTCVIPKIYCYTHFNPICFLLAICYSFALSLLFFVFLVASLCLLEEYYISKFSNCINNRRWRRHTRTHGRPKSTDRLLRCAILMLIIFQSWRTKIKYWINRFGNLCQIKLIARVQFSAKDSSVCWKEWNGTVQTDSVACVCQKCKSARARHINFRSARRCVQMEMCPKWASEHTRMRDTFGPKLRLTGYTNEPFSLHEFPYLNINFETCMDGNCTEFCVCSNVSFSTWTKMSIKQKSTVPINRLLIHTSPTPNAFVITNWMQFNFRLCTTYTHTLTDWLTTDSMQASCCYFNMWFAILHHTHLHFYTFLCLHTIRKSSEFSIYAGMARLIVPLYSATST